LQGIAEEPTSEDMEPQVAHEEVSVEDAAVMPVGEAKKRRRDRRNLVTERRQKKQQDLVAARGGTTR
jgi:tRNA 2-selenouridine synthase SelU